jgi:hypothetical protein
MFAVRERMPAPMTALKSVSRPFIDGKGHTLSGAIPSLIATESLTKGLQAFSAPMGSRFWPTPHQRGNGAAQRPDSSCLVGGELLTRLRADCLGRTDWLAVDVLGNSVPGLVVLSENVIGEGVHAGNAARAPIVAARS